MKSREDRHRGAPETVYDVMLDPARLHEWVTIHRKSIARTPASRARGSDGSDAVSAPRELQGALDTHRSRRPHHATWEGRGPAGSYARTSYRLTPDGDGTRFEYENEFKAPGGLLGKAASRVVVGGLPEREAKRSLQRLKALLEH